MAKKTLGGVEIEVDEDGFIQEPEKWNKDVAEELAKTENASPMSEDHWKLVNYLRDYYLKFEIAPAVRMVCKQTGFDLKTIYKLFPGWSGKRGLQGGGLTQAHGMCLIGRASGQ
jgi:TusE/DsrC/DsvC family sulfur relay protein